MHVYENCILFPYATDEDYELECKRGAEEEDYAADIIEETTEGPETKKAEATAEKRILRNEKLKCFVSFAYEKTSKHRKL